MSSLFVALGSDADLEVKIWAVQFCGFSSHSGIVGGPLQRPNVHRLTVWGKQFTQDYKKSILEIISCSILHREQNIMANHGTVCYQLSTGRFSIAKTLCQGIPFFAINNNFNRNIV